VLGSSAIAGSSLAKRVDRLWYRKPPRWRMLHGEQTEWRKWWRHDRSRRHGVAPTDPRHPWLSVPLQISVRIADLHRAPGE
jgi:hypothetical protein